MAEKDVIKKMDTYYDDLMGKLLELIKAQQDLSGEHKDVKKEMAKMKEYFLTLKDEMEFIHQKLDRRGFAQPQQTQQKSKMFQNQAAQGKSAERDPVEMIGSSSLFEMNVLKVFISCTKEILKMNAKAEPEFVKPIPIAEGNIPVAFLSAMDLKTNKGNGRFGLCMEREAAHLITTYTLMESRADEELADNDIQDLTQELANQICGTTKRALKADGVDIEFGLPKSYAGDNEKILKNLGEPMIILQFKFQNTFFYLHFSKI